MTLDSTFLEGQGTKVEMYIFPMFFYSKDFYKIKKAPEVEFRWETAAYIHLLGWTINYFWLSMF